MSLQMHVERLALEGMGDETVCFDKFLTAFERGKIAQHFGRSATYSDWAAFPYTLQPTPASQLAHPKQKVCIEFNGKELTTCSACRNPILGEYTVRVGTLEESTDSYADWCHLKCWRAPETLRTFQVRAEQRLFHDREVAKQIFIDPNMTYSNYGQLYEHLLDSSNYKDSDAASAASALVLTHREAASMAVSTRLVPVSMPAPKAIASEAQVADAEEAAETAHEAEASAAAEVVSIPVVRTRLPRAPTAPPPALLPPPPASPTPATAMNVDAAAVGVVATPEEEAYEETEKDDVQEEGYSVSRMSSFDDFEQKNAAPYLPPGDTQPDDVPEEGFEETQVCIAPPVIEDSAPLLEDDAVEETEGCAASPVIEDSEDRAGNLTNRSQSDSALGVQNGDGDDFQHTPSQRSQEVSVFELFNQNNSFFVGSPERSVRLAPTSPPTASLPAVAPVVPAESVFGNNVPANALKGYSFVLSGVFPEFASEDESPLSVGKPTVKAAIVSLGGRVTSAMSGAVKALVVGESPGYAKVRDARSRYAKPVVDLEGLRSFARGNSFAHIDEATILNWSRGYKRFFGEDALSPRGTTGKAARHF